MSDKPETTAKIDENTIEVDSQLALAKKQREILKGKVVSKDKNGFNIDLGEHKAYCPAAKMDYHFIHDKAAYLNKDFEFVIESFRKTMPIVSRVAALKKRAKEFRVEFKKTWEADKERVFDGKITQILDFGAFVDLGGIEGMVHISNAGHGTIRDINERLKVGDKVKAKIIKIHDKDGKQKISLSIKAATPNPWQTVKEEFEKNKRYSGRVMRLEKFGALFELAHGIEGFVRNSEMSWTKRIEHPDELLQIGDEMDIMISDFDNKRRQLVLTMRFPEDDPWKDLSQEFAAGTTHKASVDSIKNFGALFELKPGIMGMLPIGTIKKVHGESFRKKLAPGTEVEIKIAEFNSRERKIRLTLPQLQDEQEDRKDYEKFLANDKENKKESNDLGSFGALLAEKLKG